STTYLLTGANRGIGLEFAKQLSRRGKDTVLITTARKPEEAKDLARLGVEIIPLDASSEASIAGLSGRLAGLAIDVLINNAGVGSDEATLDKLSLAELQRVFMINSFAPMMIAKAVAPCLRSGGRKVIFNVTSQLGSITNNKGGSSYAYRASKAA